MNRFLAVVLLVIASVDTATGQQPGPARNATYLEIAGPGGIFSLNHEYLVGERVSIRGGFTSWSTTSFDGLDESLSAAIAGVSRHYDASSVFGGEGRLVELGLAAIVGSYTRRSFGEAEREGTFVNLSPQLGVRLQRPRGGFFLRATATPVIHLLNGGNAFPVDSPAMSAGISLGYAY